MNETFLYVGLFVFFSSGKKSNKQTNKQKKQTTVHMVHGRRVYKVRSLRGWDITFMGNKIYNVNIIKKLYI